MQPCALTATRQRAQAGGLELPESDWCRRREVQGDALEAARAFQAGRLHVGPVSRRGGGSYRSPDGSELDSG